MRLPMPLFVLPAAVIVIFAVLTVPALAESIYKWEDENGVPHYSDVPHDGAEEIEVQTVQTFKSLGVAPDSASKSVEPDDTTEMSYQSFSISSPSMEETFWNTGGELNVATSLRPGLQMGHRIRVYLDGKSRGDLQEGSSSLMLEEMTRGSHQVYAEVRDENDQMLMRTPKVNFFVQQTASDGNIRAKPLPPVALPTEAVTRSQLPPVSRRKTVR